MPFGSVSLPGKIFFVDIKGRVSYLTSNSSLFAIYGAGLEIPLLKNIYKKTICFTDGDLKSMLLD